MKKILFTALKILGWTLLLALAVGLVYLLTVARGWPLWTGAVLLLGPAGVILAVIAVRKHLFRRREKRYVKRIIDQESEKLVQADSARRDRTVNDLRDIFAKAGRIIDRLRPGRLGGPGYVLPWYLLLGASGAGKSAALRAARLNAVATDLTPTGEAGPTALLDVWFLDRAVVLDPAGRLASGEGGAAGEEWEEFLTLLTRRRRREPLSGLVIAFPADELLTAGEDALTAKARGLRRRLDEIMRALGARVPVYLLLTKLDAIPGMTGFFAGLDTDEANSAMGVLRTTEQEPAAAWTMAALAEIGDQLKTLRLRLAGRQGPVEPGLAAFPDALAALGPGLAVVARELFQPNPFLETPFLRGLYFGSARQSGDDLSRAAGAMAAFARLPVAGAPSTRGFFLHDLFAAVLPDDRGRAAPLRSYLSWRTLTRLAALFACLALAGCFVGLTVFSYIRNDAVMDAFIEDFREVPRLGPSFGQNVTLMAKFREELTFMEGQNRGWDWPRMGLDQTVEAERRLKTAYCDIFDKGVLTQYDFALRHEIDRVLASGNHEQTTALAAYLASRLNLLESAQAGAVNANAAQALSHDMQALTFSGQPVDRFFADGFMKLYLSRLRWTKNAPALAAERENLVVMLKDVIRGSRVELSWLIDWANSLPELDPIYYEQFWDPTAMAHVQGVMIKPAYTLAGRDKIMAFISRLKTALGGSASDQNWSAVFLDWYAGEYLASWERFASSFSDALAWDRDQMEWKALAIRMADPDNPYFHFLDTLARQTAPFASRPHVPSWVRAVAAWGQLRQSIAEPAVAQVEIALQKKETSIKGFFEGVTRYLRDDTPPGAPPKAGPKPSAAPSSDDPDYLAKTQGLAGMKPYQAYVDALGSVLQATQSPTATLALTAAVYSPPAPAAPAAPGKPEAPGTPFDAARKSAAELAKSLAQDPPPLFTDLLNGPLSFFWAYLVIDSATALETAWQSGVVGPSTSLPDKKRNGVLFAEPGGLVWKFADGPAAPFLQRNQYGFTAREAGNVRFPFTDEFLTFLNKGSKQTQQILPQYQVGIQALPTDVNRGATEDPFLTTLTLDCVEKVQKIENYNYPVSLDFEWKPDTCGDASLVVQFGAVTARKTYAGAMGFPAFLKDFEYNSKTFKASDFPEAARGLAVAGVTEITVNFRIQGGEPLVKLTGLGHLSVPRTITRGKRP